MNPITQLIADLTVIRRHIDRKAGPDEARNKIALAYILANRQPILHYVGKVFEYTKKARHNVAEEFPAVDFSVVTPEFRSVAEHTIVSAESAWLGVGCPSEDDVHMTIRALRAAEALLPDPVGNLLLSPIDAYLEGEGR